MSKEKILLEGWKLKIGILTAIVVPSITATAAFYNFKNEVNDKISDLQFQTERDKADKASLRDLANDMKQMREDISLIKALLERGRR